MDAVENDIVEALDALVADVHADAAMIERLLRDARSADPAPENARHLFWVRPLLAAAVALAVAAVAALLVRLPGRGDSPASPHRSSHPHPSQRTPAPSERPRFRELSCTVVQPKAWQRAFSLVRPPGAPIAVDYAGAGMTTLGVSSDGDVLAYSNVGAGAAVLVRPNGHTKILYQVPSSLVGHHDLRIAAGGIDHGWADFDVVEGTGELSVLAIDAVNLVSGSVHTLWQTQPGADTKLGVSGIVSGPQLLGRRVYWSEVSNSEHGRVIAYDLVRGSTSTISTGTIVGPQTVAGRVEWTRNGRIVGTGGGPALPSVFHPQPGRTTTLLHDGSAFAWSAWSGASRAQRLVIRMQTSAMAHPDTVYAAPNSDTHPTLLALSGPYVVFDDTQHLVALDTRTGAATDLMNSQPPVTGAQAAGGGIALSEVGARGGTQLVLIRTSELTELTC